ncbi:hypothetical protein, partial [Escherichia coli]|uniref:hypothetical protein n=1 Tax=Escherichia coli TaxID=562 RepID=UPI0028E0225D
FAGRVVKPLCQLPQIACLHQGVQMPVNRIGHHSQIGTTVHTPWLKDMPDLLQRTGLFVTGHEA